MDSGTGKMSMLDDTKRSTFPLCCFAFAFSMSNDTSLGKQSRERMESRAEVSVLSQDDLNSMPWYGKG